MAKTIVLAQQARQGTFTSSSVLIPANATGRVQIAADIHAADLEDIGKSIIFNCEASHDGGASWSHVVGFEWHAEVGSGQPRVTIPLAPLAGARLRAVLDIPLSIRVGATLTTP